MKNWIPLSTILKLEHETIKPLNLVREKFTARYEVHENIGSKKTGYKDVQMFDVRLPDWGYRQDWLIVDETVPVIRSLGYHKQYSNESILGLIKDAATKDFFGALEQADFHHIEVMMTDGNVVFVN